MRIIFATGNEDKMREIREIFGEDFPETCKLMTMKEAGVFASPEENGRTFAENAEIKARAVRALLDREEEKKRLRGETVEESLVLSDDSGLCVDALDGAPGIYSARFMGSETPYAKKNRAILEELQKKAAGEEDRGARFVCAVAAVFPDGELLLAEETLEGRIAGEIFGEGGFGYDPIFFLPDYGCTAAQLSPSEKNKISHRGKALRRMRSLIFEKG